tara:strand:+ start:1022 stop:1921 length:900 start_codon:yes stop_codon:yes gene_type:complete
MKAHKKLVIVVLGATASGKTDLAIQIAEYFKLRIHNIDSRQLYIGMNIGTAKPTIDQQKRVKHFLIDICQPNQPITLHDFKEKASSSLEATLETEKIGLLVGGSGLYLKALTSGLEPPPVPPQIFLREQLKKIDQSECHQMLQSCDPLTAKKVAPADAIRTIRALEVFYATGIPMSFQRKANPPSWNLLEVGLDPKNLSERIERRTKSMYSNGLIEETQKLIEKFGADLPLLKTIGYQEAIDIIQGRITFREAIALTNQRTKNFAKRQKTWFKKQHSPKWLNDQNPFKESIALIQEVIG